MNGMAALNQYRQVVNQGGIIDASPHQLILMLMDGAMGRISTAKGCLQRGEVARKGELISGAISIIEGLRGSLNHEAGGEIARNLDNLYEYMTRQLVRANLDNGAAPLDEVTALLREVKEAWIAIPAEPRTSHARRASELA